MMKSFFKKLSLVMALAMVVSMVAPAGSAFAAEAGIAHQGTKTVVTEANVEIGEDVADFCFLGAPADWKTTYEWTSDDKTVATVDKAGKVTGLKDGVATITITAGADASYKHSVVVTVGKGDVAAKAFEVKQLSTNVVKLTFAESKNVTVDTLVFGTFYGDTYIEQPVKSVNVNNNEAVVTLYSALVDGGLYNFTFDGYTAELTASAGEIHRVSFDYWTDEAGDGKAYVPENDADGATTTLVAHFYDAADVEVTELYPDVEVTYDLTVENENVDLIDNTVTFTEPTVAQITLTVSWMNEEGEDVGKEYPGVVVAVNRPALKFEKLGAGVFDPTWWDADADGALASFLTDADGYVWSNEEYTTTFIDGDEQSDDLVFGAAFADNRGNKVTTGAVDYTYGTFVFESTNDKVIAVEEESGAIAVVGEGKANIIVSFVPSEVEEGDPEKIYVTYQTITVKPARYAATYKVASTSKKATTVGNSQTGSFILGVFDQYGDLIALTNHEADLSVEATSTKNEVELDFEEANGYVGAFDKSGPYYVMSYDGADFADAVAKNSAKFNYKITLDKEENDTISTSATTSVSLTVYDGATTAYYEKLVAGTATAFKYSTYASKTSVDLAVNNVANYRYTWKNPAQKTVSINATYLDTTSELALKGVSDLTEKGAKQTTGDAGVVYYAVSAPKNAVNWDYDKVGNNVVLSFNNLEAKEDGVTVNGGFAYATTGVYKVTLYTAAKDGGSLKALTTYSINVSNSQPDVAFAKFNDELGNETTEEITEDMDADAIEALVKANMEFTADVAHITEVDAKAFDGKLYIKKVTFELPLDDADEETEYTVTKVVTVKKYIYEVEAE